MELNPYYKSQAERDHLEEMMEKYFRFNKQLGLTEARTKEEFYGFAVSQVWKVHLHKQGVGSGVFYRLISGFVFDVQGEQHESDETLYDQTTHWPQRRAFSLAFAFTPLPLNGTRGFLLSVRERRSRARHASLAYLALHCSALISQN